MTEEPIFKIEAWDGLPCHGTLTIRGVDADQDDFGRTEDVSPETAEEYACGNMRFIPKMPTQAVLDKYRITLDEYAEIASALENELSPGSCGWCQ